MHFVGLRVSIGERGGTLNSKKHLKAQADLKEIRFETVWIKWGYIFFWLGFGTRPPIILTP